MSTAPLLVYISCKDTIGLRRWAIQFVWVLTTSNSCGREYNKERAAWTLANQPSADHPSKRKHFLFGSQAGNFITSLKMYQGRHTVRYFAIILSIIVIMCLTMLISLLNKQLSRLGLFIQSSFSSKSELPAFLLALGPSSLVSICKKGN